MKRLIAILLTILYVTALFGCGKQPETQPSGTTDSTTAAPSNPTEPTVPNTEPTVNPDDPEDPPAVPLEEPPVPTTWVTNYNGNVNLRSKPYGDIIAKVPNDAPMELLGWVDKYAKVNYNGAVGYISANYIKPQDESYFGKCLDVVEMTNIYTYDMMISDIATLINQHPDRVEISSIGSSELGRSIPVLRIGNLDAETHILFQGAMHAREHMTAWLLMALTEYWLDFNILGDEDVCYHIIPMVNPDGVTLSQTQTLTEDQREIYQNDLNHGHTNLGEKDYAAMWKANGVGVDLNRNFPSNWCNLYNRTGPSSEGYEGPTPFSASETIALRDYTYKYDFDATISYHSSGSIIYPEYGNKEPINSLSRSLANAVNKVTGYGSIGSSPNSGAGYKDWVMDELEIPSLTIEIGVEDSPLELREIYTIFVRNQQVLPAIYDWLQA